MTRRHKTSYPIRCWQMLGTAAVTLGAFALIGLAAAGLHAAVTWYFGAR